MQSVQQPEFEYAFGGNFSHTSTGSIWGRLPRPWASALCRRRRRESPQRTLHLLSWCWGSGMGNCLLLFTWQGLLAGSGTHSCYLKKVHQACAATRGLRVQFHLHATIVLLIRMKPSFATQSTGAMYTHTCAVDWSEMGSGSRFLVECNKHGALPLANMEAP